MKAALFIPCYVDAFFPEVGIATLELLERLGVEVDYPLDQTCCGQPMAQQRLPRRCGRDRSAVRQEFRRLRLHRHALRQLRAPRAREPHRHSANRGDGRGPAAHLRAGRVRARRARGPRVPVGGVPARGGAAQRLRVVAGAADRQDVRDRRAVLLEAARSAVEGERNPVRHAGASRRVLRLRRNVFGIRGAGLGEDGLRQGDRPPEGGRGIHRIRRHVLPHASEGMRGAPGPSDQVHPYRADPNGARAHEAHRPRRSVLEVHRGQGPSRLPRQAAVGPAQEARPGERAPARVGGAAHAGVGDQGAHADPPRRLSGGVRAQRDHATARTCIGPRTPPSTTRSCSTS